MIQKGIYFKSTSPSVECNLVSVTKNETQQQMFMDFNERPGRSTFTTKLLSGNIKKIVDDEQNLRIELDMDIVVFSIQYSFS